MNDATRKKIEDNQARIKALDYQIQQLELENAFLRNRDNPAICQYCGRFWPPSKMESESYPGSMCDIGECVQ